jgi:hypothetical protein
MKQKKLLFILGLLLSSLFLTSCGDDDSPRVDTDGSASALPAPSVDCGGSECI